MSQTVDRAFALLEQIAIGPQSIGMLATHIGVHKSTALRLAQTLERAGFVARRQDGMYALGSRVLTMAAQALESFDVRDIARPHLRRLNEISGQTVHLATLVDLEVIYIDKYEGRSPIRMYSRLGKVASVSTSAVGKVILAFQDEPLLERLIELIDFQRHTPATIVTGQALREELATIRERGYGVDRGEFEGLINCIAAPIRAADGSVSSSVSISVATMVVTLDELLQLLPELTAATDAISAECGWTGGTRPGGTGNHLRLQGGPMSSGPDQPGADVPTTHGGVKPLAVDKRA